MVDGATVATNAPDAWLGEGFGLVQRAKINPLKISFWCLISGATRIKSLKKSVLYNWHIIYVYINKHYFYTRSERVY